MLCSESGGVIAPGGVTTSAAADAVLVRIGGLSPEALQGLP